MLPIILIISVGLGVSALIGGLAISLRPTEDQATEDRLSALTAHSKGGGAVADAPTMLTRSPLDDTKSLADAILSRIGNISTLMDQADVKLSGTQFLTICISAFAFGSIACLVSPLPKYLFPLFGLSLASIPVLWLVLKRNKRMNMFTKQLPEALELLSRSLRAGHSLAAGLGLVGGEMPAPLGTEFGRAFDEQNLGLSLDEALEQMSNRVPNLDLRFFVTAVTLQRQTGGDLSEILDKIGRLIRERFKLSGQIQALTGEGRLSGIVLLALPPVLFLVMLYINYDYAMVLFRDDDGKKLLAFALVMQLLGALLIRKIINIKV